MTWAMDMHLNGGYEVKEWMGYHFRFCNYYDAPFSELDNQFWLARDRFSAKDFLWNLILSASCYLDIRDLYQYAKPHDYFMHKKSDWALIDELAYMMECNELLVLVLYDPMKQDLPSHISQNQPMAGSLSESNEQTAKAVAKRSQSPASEASERSSEANVYENNSTVRENISVSDSTLINGAAFRHQTRWTPNETGPRSVDDALSLADEYDVYIADDVNIRFVDDAFYDRQFGKYGDSYASYGHVEIGNPNQQLTWKDTLADKDGNVNVYIRKSVLDSDEAIVAVLHHETHEVEALRDIFAHRVSIPAKEYGRLINDSTPGNLHWEAVEIGDQAVRKLRQDRGLKI